MSSTDSNSGSDQAHDARKSAEAFVAQLLAEFGDDVFSAKEVLQQHPFLEDFQSCVIDLAYEEFCRRCEHGENLAATQFVKDYEDVEQSLYRVIEFDQVLHDHPSLIESIPEHRWPKAGDVFCGFELYEQIGKGALSRVFVAHQTGLGRRRVIVKICVRGEREADFLGKLEYDGIAAVHSVHPDSETGLVAICMPHVTRATMHHVSEWLAGFDRSMCSGGVLRRLVNRYNEGQKAVANRKSTTAIKLEPSYSKTVQDGDSLGYVIIKWGIQLARALEFAHSQGVLHCDVKPANVLITDELAASLLDFNLAASSEDELGLAGGTLPFMASEQLAQLIRLPEAAQSGCDDSDRMVVSPRTDVFGLCATLWCLATGDPPFGVGADMKSRRQAASLIRFRQQKGLDSTKLAALSEILPDGLNEILIKGLKYEPSDRFNSAKELADALQLLLPKPPVVADVRSQAESEESHSTDPPAPKKFYRRILLTTAVSVILCFAVQPYLPSDNSPDIDTGPVISEARSQIEKQEFAEAQETLKDYIDKDDHCRFLDLVCQSALLRGLQFQVTATVGTMSASTGVANSPVALAHEQNIHLESLRNDWKELATDGEFRGEAAHNLAFLEMEFGTWKGFVSANKWFESAARAGLVTVQSDRARALLKLVDHRANTATTSKGLIEIRDEVFSKGTRGEFLAFTAAVRNILRNEEPSPEAIELLTSVVQNLASVETARAESFAAQLLVLPNSVDQNLRNLVKALGRGTRGADPARNNFNRLREVLVLPQVPSDRPSEDLRER